VACLSFFLRARGSPRKRRRFFLFHARLFQGPFFFFFQSPLRAVPGRAVRAIRFFGFFERPPDPLFARAGDKIASPLSWEVSLPSPSPFFCDERASPFEDGFFSLSANGFWVGDDPPWAFFFFSSSPPRLFLLPSPF